MPVLPTHPGTYVLHLFLEADQQLQIGKLGVFHLPAGHYLYPGSAHGRGGLQARVSRHIHKRGKLHWHIDSLRPITRVLEVFYTLDSVASGCQPLECCWGQALAALPEAALPVPGFGASDCRSHCSAHLVAFPARASTCLSKGIDQAIRAQGVAVSYIRVNSVPDPFIDGGNEVK